MSHVKERLEQMRRTGAAVPARAPTPVPADGSVSARARRYAGGAEDYPSPPAAEDAGGYARAPEVAAPSLPQAPPSTATPPRSRLERFGTGGGQPAAASRPAAPSIVAEGAPLAPAPPPGGETSEQAGVFAHCMDMWRLTPQRDCDRELVLHAAAWYERNAPWALSGVHAMVVAALDKPREQQQSRDSRTPRLAGPDPADDAAAAVQCAQSSSSSRAARYGRERG